MVKVIDKNWQPLPNTTRNGKVRKLLKEKKARVVNDNPFTIQLLYDINKNSDMDNTQLNSIVVSDCKVFPKELHDKKIKLYTLDEFKQEACGKGIDAYKLETVYMDVDCLDMSLYEALKDYTDNGINIIFFKYKKPYIKEDIYTFTPLEKSLEERLDDLNIRIAKDTYIHGNILICGESITDAQAVLNNIKQQLSNKGITINYFDSTCDVKQLAEFLQEKRKLVLYRFKQMEEQHVGRITQLENVSITPETIIIDDYNKITSSSDYESVDVIKQALYSILMFCKNVGISVIVRNSTIKSLGADIVNNLTNNIIVKGLSLEEYNYKFNKTPYTNIPEGIALYNGFSYEQNKHINTIFNISDIVNY